MLGAMSLGECSGDVVKIVSFWVEDSESRNFEFEIWTSDM